MAKPRRLFSGLSVLGLCLLLLTGCAVPGGYDVDILHQQPEAALVYPGSTDVHTDDYNGRPGNYVSKGAVARTGKSATTTHTQLEVLAYFSRTRAADGGSKLRKMFGLLHRRAYPLIGLRGINRNFTSPTSWRYGR